MPELTPQQKLLEKLYRGKTQARPPTLKQKSLNRSFNKPSVSNAQKAQGARTSTSAAIRSKIRSTKAAYKSDLSRFSREVTTTSSKARISSAQNISKFGGGVKARLGPTVVAVKTLAVKQGIKTPVLSRLLIGGGRFLAWTKANPGLALVVGNLIVWKKNIADIKKLYNMFAPAGQLQFPPTEDFVTSGSPPPFTGGQSPGIEYYVQQLINTYNADGTVRGTNELSTLLRFYGPITRSYLERRYDNRGNLLYWGIVYAHNQDGSEYIWENPVSVSGSTMILSRTEITRVDGRPDTGGNPPPITEPVYSSGGLASPTVVPVLPQEVNTNKPTAFKPPSVLPKIKPEEEADKKTPVVEPAPSVVPELQPLPDDDVEKQLIIPLDRPTIRSDDPTAPVEQKKPANATVTITRYASPQELEDIRKVIEEDRKKRQLSTDFEAEFEVDKLKFGIPSIAENQQTNKEGTNKQEDLSKTKKTLFRPIVPVVPTVERPTEIRTSTGTGTNFPIIAPLPGYKLQEPKAPAPTVTPVSGCSKGCAGGTGGGLSQADSNNLAKAADASAQLAILGIVKNTNEAVRHAKYGLEAVQKFGETAWKVTQADKVMAGVTMALTIHNAMMLSNNLLSTMSEATNMALNALNIRDETDSPLDFGTLVKGKITSVLTSILGQSQYEALTARIAKANRIYQSSINLLDTTRNLFDSAQSIAEINARYTGEIGNALRNARVVAEDAYEEMIEKMNPQSKGLLGLQKFTDGIEAVESAFDSVTQISSNVVEIQDNIGQLETEKTALIAEIDEDKKNKETERKITKINSTVTAEIASADFESAPPTEE